VDIDGEPWASPPSIGCDEFYAGSVTGALSATIQAPYTNFATGFAAAFAANISGRVSASTWDFGDGTVVSNRPYASHAWAVAGDYAVVLRAYNNSYPGGVSATTLVQVVTQPVHYVSLSSAAPLTPYTSWETAATNIQSAVDAASVPGAQVLAWVYTDQSSPKLCAI
jgi:PKD repeat protein